MSIEFSAAKTLAASAEYAEAAVPVSPEAAVSPYKFTLSLERATLEAVALFAVDEAGMAADVNCKGIKLPRPVAPSSPPALCLCRSLWAEVASINGQRKSNGHMVDSCTVALKSNSPVESKTEQKNEEERLETISQKKFKLFARNVLWP